ncbi:Hypothetical protein LUCI_4368 [Lucifera butyrica]|uniref:Outer membrane protein beta-barrel n=1 Tax=Lucifera butyrica TaxID=1351585 RepID=A0A498RG80_9FIRM|nr:hypothetical protein [Lucifera butyrica]VBB09082.1 Hypothetical protein LUCI_4368 [Lucifera butyrica]
MNKKILTILAGSMLFATTAFAAPITDLQQGETAIGYNHYDLSHSTSDDSFYLENAVSPQFILGVERNGYTDFHTTDIYAQYKLDPNVRLIAGNRDYSDDNSQFFYGIGANVNLSNNLDGYVSVTTSSSATEWQTGLNFKMNSQTSLNLGYKSLKRDYYPTYDGLGFGINYKF